MSITDDDDNDGDNDDFQYCNCDVGDWPYVFALGFSLVDVFFPKNLELFRHGALRELEGLNEVAGITTLVRVDERVSVP